MKLLNVLTVVLLLAPAGAGAQDVRSEKHQEQPAAPEKRHRQPEPKALEASAGISMVSDSNISHLLVNSPANSDARIKDNIRRLEADVTAKPAFARPAGLELSYAYNDYAYRTHKTFDYHTHALSAGLAPGLGAGLRLDLGWDLDLTGDKRGVIAENAVLRAGLAWRGPAGLQLKGGYERERDNVRTNYLKDARTDALYLSASKRLAKEQLGFLGLRWHDHAAAGANYSYRSRTALLGLVSKWAPGFKLVSAVSLTRKDYDNKDTRFNKKRGDTTGALTLKPSLKLYGPLHATGSFTYLKNASNVSLKSYTDTIYSLGLEARF